MSPLGLGFVICKMGVQVRLYQRYSVCGPPTNSISTTWEIAGLPVTGSLKYNVHPHRWDSGLPAENQRSGVRKLQPTGQIWSSACFSQAREPGIDRFYILK